MALLPAPRLATPAAPPQATAPAPAIEPAIQPQRPEPASGTNPPSVVAANDPARVSIEPAYSALGHPRLATEMLTLGRDDELFQWALGGSADPAHPSNRAGYHPATRVVVDVELLSRAPKGTTRRLLATARSNGYWPLRSCFEAAQRLVVKTQRSARVRLSLSAFGKILGARSVGPAPERDYARCVLERMRALDFTPGFTRKLDVEISLRQWPGHAPVPPRAPESAPDVRLSAQGQAALEALSPALSACYRTGLASDAKLWGRIALRLKLGEGGSVRKWRPASRATASSSARAKPCSARVSMQEPRAS